MMRNVFKLAAVWLSLFLLTACSGPETPQEVTEAFWQAVMEDDADGVARYSTMATPAEYPQLEADWSAASLALGRTVIEEREATVVTVFKGIEGAGDEGREVATYLVLRDEQWKVDYQPTADAFAARSALQKFVGELGRLSDQIKSSFSRSSDALAERMDDMASEMRALSDSATAEASAALEEYSERLRKHIEELTESLEEALKDEKQASPQDRELLETSIRDLNTRNAQLEDPDFESIAASSTTVAETRVRLQALDQQVFADYEEDWQEWVEDIEQDVNDLLEDIRAGMRKG